MAVSVVMPALEMAQETGKLVSWKKREGDQVAKGDLLLEVETDKAVVEVEALADGILAAVTAKPGDVVPVGQTIAWLVKPGESPPAGSVPVQTGRTGAAAAPAAAPATPVSAAAAPPPAAAGPAASVRISPKARRLAKEHGIDVRTVAGTGPEGEILASDIAALVKMGQAGPAAAGGVPAPAARPSSAAPVTGTGVPASLSAIGRLMAERTTQSWTSAPHFFVTREVDGGALVALRQRLVPEIERSHGVKVTYTDLLVAIVARVLRRHPRMNASWVNGAIVANADVNLGLAMAVEDGVVAPAVPRADVMAIGDIALRRRELTERARGNRLQPADITGATFTISNLGMFEVDNFTAIIVPPQAGILAVGAMTDRVVPIAGATGVGIGVRPMMTLTLSCDHRVLDGARGAAFLSDVVTALGTPEQALA